MKRNVTLDEISDGRLYSVNDMVKADCNDCKGCSACCQGMGASIVLDPLDIHRLTSNLTCSFEALLSSSIELHMAEGLILPNLKMAGEKERCTFLNQEGRCRIHSFRPGICRLFPMGRYYQERSFQYFLQVHECPKEHKTKVKIRKWIDTPDIKKNEQFIIQWHDYLKDLQEVLSEVKEAETMKSISMYLLKNFYMIPFHADTDFYEQFNQRLKEAEKQIQSHVPERIKPWNY